ncbi:protein of unknown function [Prevotella sp. khp7]|uniref:DUF4153 domain-containing protein n=1 Tax=Prevotella sp. khp7 TaxID=1761885 RepID=UPI0008D3563F|nr:DUF4153 domain-containing protein [Prevotella sp. khp7]SEW14908.1 protein of unknown function [Prevotella sp. khp7]
MNTKLKSLLQQLLQSPRRFPVEFALGVVFFIIAVWDSETSAWNEAAARMEGAVKSDILWFFVPLVALSFWLRRVNRWAYFASFFLFLPLMALDLKPFLWTYGFAFTYVLAGILLVVGNRKLDNRSFAAHALHVVTQMFFGLLITGILDMAVMAIVASFFYIFGIEEPQHFYEHITQFILFVLAPQVCCTLIRQNEDEVSEPFKVLRLIVNFILSPAVIICTVILYTYFIKIVFEWNLPKGGVAWMVMGFITVALVGRTAQSILSKRYYDWFYSRFTLIAIPPLIMYWIGSIYRIRLYSFTESRFYLMVAGGLMTLFVLMLWKKRTRKYQLMALIFGAAIILFTYIPGISAKSIGLSCQKQRLTRLISELKLTDAKTGKLNDEVNMRRIKQDSLLCEQYQDVTSVIDYVRHEIGTDEFEKQYGEWSHSEYSFYYSNSKNPYDNGNCYERKKAVDLGDYSIMLPEDQYSCSFGNSRVTVMCGDAVVLEYPICTIMRQDTMLLHHPEQLLTYRNDSLMLVLQSICIKDTVVTDVRCYDFQLFKKQTITAPWHYVCCEKKAPEINREP